jgi:exodeoxyribonuclease V beta subunit
LREICLQAVAAKAVDGRKMQARYFEPWFEKISAWAADESLEQLDIGTGFTRLTPGRAWPKPGRGEPPHHPGIDAMASLKASLDALPTPPTPPCCNTPPRGSANASKMKNAGAPKWASTTC